MGDHIINLSARRIKWQVTGWGKWVVTTTALALTTSALLSGCGVSVNDATSRSDDKPMGLSTTGCINDALPAIQRYFQAQSSAGEVTNTWQCFSSSLLLFSTYITPANPNYYTKTELQGFIQNFVMGPKVILTDDLMSQVMKVKQVVLGGDNDKITRAELARAQQLIATLQSQSIHLLPHLRVLFMLDDPSSGVITPDEIAQSQLAMSQFVDSLAPYIGSASIAYDVASAQALLTEFDQLYTHVDGWEGPAKIVNYLNSFAAFKVMLAKAPGTTIEAGEWLGLFHQISDGYAIWLRYHYAIDHSQMVTSDANLTQWSLIAGQLRDLLNTAVVQKPNQVIDYATIEAVIHEVYRLNLFKMPLTETTLRGALRPIIGKLLNPVKNGTRAAANGINTATLDYVLQNIQSLFEMQSLYLQVVDRAGSASHVTYQTLRQIWPTLAHHYTDAWQGMQTIFNARFPIYTNGDGALVYNNDVVDEAITSDQYFGLNWERGAVSLLIAGYSSRPDTTKITGLTNEEWLQIYNDLHPVAEELGLFKARDTLTWKNLATYAEMFMPNSDGGTGVTFNEGVETVSTLMSASTIGSHIFAELSDQCQTVTVDSAQELAIPIACFRQYFKSDMSREFTNFPEMVRQLNALSDDDYSTFLDNMQLVMRQAGNGPNAPFTNVELTNAANFLHFVESLMWRFDSNHDGSLTVAESMTAYPVFKNLLIRASGYKTDKTLQSVFTYMLKYKESPKQNIWNTARYLWWSLNSSSWDYDDSRADLVAVMAAISAASSTAAAK